MHLVDANVLIEAKNRYIEAKNRYYAFDIAPGFWVWLEQGHRTGKLISIDAVRDELVQGDDELAEWARGRRDFFLPIDQLTVQRFRTLSDWARHQNYRQSALNDFSSDRADFLLIAPAIGHGDTVITNEQPSPQAQKRAKIPDACAGYPACGKGSLTLLSPSRPASPSVSAEQGAGGGEPAPYPRVCTSARRRASVPGSGRTPEHDDVRRTS